MCRETEKRRERDRALGRTQKWAEEEYRVQHLVPNDRLPIDLASSHAVVTPKTGGNAGDPRGDSWSLPVRESLTGLPGTQWLLPPAGSLGCDSLGACPPDTLTARGGPVLSEPWRLTTPQAAGSC